MIKIALNYIRDGFSVIPVTERTKEPTVPTWTEQQSRAYTDEECHIYFNDAVGIAVICGAVSGGLTVLDIDSKVNPERGEQFMDAFRELMGDDYNDQYVIKTPSGGYHIYYRAAEIKRNKHIAKLESGVLIETRGEGGYVAAPPTPDYNVINGSSDSVPVWTDDRVEDVWALAYSFNEVREKPPRAERRAKRVNTTHRVTVLDDYNNDNHFEDVLRAAGWTVVRHHGDRTMWRRPGSNNRQSANWSDTHRKLYVFTDNTEFTAGEAYSPAAIFAFIECGGDFGEAAKRLAEMGYGKLLTDGDRQRIDDISNMMKRGYPVEQLRAMAGDGPVGERLLEIAKSKAKSGNKQEWANEYIDGLDVRFNEVTRKLEWDDGTPLDDRDVNTIAVDAKLANGKISYGMVEKTLFSGRVRGFHPIKQYFDQIRDTEHDNEIERLFNTLRIGDAGNDRDMLFRLFKKWLIQLIATVYGTPAELVLVLVGGQNVGKTTFFTSLLPRPLMPYFTTDTLTEGKDSEIKMTESLLILEDEWGGHTKREAEFFKSLLSRQSFKIRRPYGRVMETLPRLAVLAGTSNNIDVINDPTGNRRVLPLFLLGRDFAASQDISRDALFAEMIDVWEREGTDAVWLTAEDRQFLTDFSSSFETVNETHERITRMFVTGGPNDWMTATEVTDILNGDSEGYKLWANVVGRELMAAGFERVRRRFDGRVQRMYNIKKRVFNDPLDGYSPQNPGLESDDDLPF